MNASTTGRNRPPGEVWMLLKDRKLLARLMAIQRYSQRELARDAGFASHSYLGRMIAGKATSCTAERAVAIAACLQVPLDSLFVANVSSAETQSVQRRSTTRPFRPTRGSEGPGRSGGSASGVGTTRVASSERASA